MALGDNCETFLSFPLNRCRYWSKRCCWSQKKTRRKLILRYFYSFSFILSIFFFFFSFYSHFSSFSYFFSRFLYFFLQSIKNFNYSFKKLIKKSVWAHDGDVMEVRTRNIYIFLAHLAMILSYGVAFCWLDVSSNYCGKI